MLTTEQQDFYDQNGYLMVENVITKDQLNKLQTITYEFIEASRNIQENDDVFDLDEGHSAENPRLTPRMTTRNTHWPFPIGDGHIHPSLWHQS